MSRAAIVLGAGAALFLAASLLGKRSILSGDYLFPYRDDVYLRAGQRLGGQAYVPPGTRDGARLLVYLHGNNEGGALHSAMGARGDSFDLRTLAPPGTIVAAPSQTKNASGAGLWAGFDLDAFVAAVEDATGASIDRSRVVLMGHSGAGCSSVGGLLAPLKTIRPQLVAVVDVCGGAGFGAAFGKLGEEVPVHVFFQTRSWARDFDGFAKALAGRARFEEIRTPDGQNPHDAIVPIVTQRVLA